jgi:hypothetical protein
MILSAPSTKSVPLESVPSLQGATRSARVPAGEPAALAAEPAPVFHLSLGEQLEGVP